MIGLWVVLGTLAVAVAVGLLLRARNGRIRANDRKDDSPVLPEPVATALPAGDSLALVQLSTTFCAPCRHARAVLSRLAETTDAVEHVELDITDRPEVAQQLGVLRTPTTLALTSTGREVLRISGVPRSAELRDALREHLPGAGQASESSH